MAVDGFQDLLDEFLLEGRERIDRVEEIVLDLETATEEHKAELIGEAKRELHTLKGNAAMMGFHDLQNTAHELEDEVESLDLTAPDLTNILVGLDQLRSRLDSLRRGVALPEVDEAVAAADATARDEGAETVPESVRVSFTVLDTLVDQLAEMVIFRNRLSDALEQVGALLAGGSPETVDAWMEAKQAQEALTKTLDFIQDNVMNLRMVPLKTLFRHLRRIIYDETARTGKQVDFRTVGGDTPMDKVLLEVASEALGHMVRNAVTHGIESPTDRRRAGKAATGIVRLTASTRSNEVQIDVEDDGAGIDREALVEAARQRGIEVPPEEEIQSLVFAAGVSTKAQADLSAGRGIGLFAVYDAVQRHSGRVEIHSEPGVGSRFRLRLPLSVSITHALLLETDGEEYALPISAITESLRFEAGESHEVNQANVFRWRDSVLPLVDLGCVLGTANDLRGSGYIVVIEAEGRYRGVVVDQITEYREIVVKGLDPIVGTPQGISGSTILGDGRVILILDPLSLMTVAPFVGSAT